MGDSALLDDLLEPFAECLDTESALRIVNLGISPELQQRVDALAERANEGTLTEQERIDYEALINAADFIALVKIKARDRLDRSARS